MSENLDALEARLRNLQLVQGVVSAMWAIARAQLPSVEAAVAESATYLAWLVRLVERVAGAEKTLSAREQLHVVLGPDRSFCGALSRQLLAQLPQTGSLGIVGRAFAETARSDPRVRERIVFELAGPQTVDDAADVARQLAREMLAYRKQTIDLWYPMEGESQFMRALLLSDFEARRSDVPESYSPLSLVLEAALTELTQSRLTFGLLEALRTEVRARLLTTESARKNLERRSDEVTHELRRIRRTQITNELLEVVAGHRAQHPH